MHTKGIKRRVLFLSAYHLGWKTLAHGLEEYSKLQPDLDVVHSRVVLPPWIRLLSRQWPKPFHRLGIGFSTGWRWHMVATYRKTILNGKFDIVYVNSQILAAGLIDICKQAGAKLAVSIDVTGPAYVRDLLREPANPDQNWQEERSIYEAADLIVPWSEWIATSLVCDFGVPRQKIIVLPPAVDTRQFRADEALRAAHKLPRILFCGNDWQRKGGPRLLQWHQQHWAEIAELHIASAKAVVPPGLKNVFFLGSVPHQRLVKEILPAASLFCMPTRQDMSPYAVSEAQASGLPTVSSRVGGISEQVLDGITGFVLPMDDDAAFVSTVGRLLKDPALRLEMGRAARRHAATNLDAGLSFKRLFQRLAEEAGEFSQ